ncbi:3-hydroxydecanoyl-ACP dehydratase [Vibrio sp. MACH09]|uniref:hotdog family protein n=1 Tax=unclassified Vibrio TaxID=2614977 RepID=UPI001493C043|nr:MULTISPECIES: hotdog family protein [unclassified Vibrio]NOI68268.1 hotdog family protein [Vibrio sp. 99-8-1]GLO62004.1 3-hydroxydecanoyl-ACP dehydratase [Vibrio sp. MACH09]
MNDLPSIEKLVPHDNPMILVDRAITIEEKSIHCQVDIGEHNPFFDVEKETVPAYVGIEFMAQSVAAWSGYHALLENNSPPIGFLLGSRRYTAMCDKFTKNQTLDIYAEQVLADDNMAVFMARLEDRGEVLASCQLNVYVPTEQQLQQMKTGNLS